MNKIFDRLAPLNDFSTAMPGSFDRPAPLSYVRTSRLSVVVSVIFGELKSVAAGDMSIPMLTAVGCCQAPAQTMKQGIQKIFNAMEIPMRIQLDHF